MRVSFSFKYLPRLKLGLLSSLLLLASCGGKYQAPVRDQGEQQLNRAPIIVQSSGNENGGRVIERGSTTGDTGAIGTSTRGTSTRATASASVARSQPVIVSPASRSPRPVSRPTRSATGSGSHIVRAGETLYSIAFQYDLDFRSLALANNLRAPFTIFVEQELNLNVSDLNRNTADSAINSTVGSAVSDNPVAQSQGGSSRAGRVLRQPIQASNATPSWSWPHDGRILRGFRDADNKGLDIQGQLGDPVLAAGAGDVVYSGRGVQGSGNLIIIRHNDRYLSAYAHNSAMLVAEGARVATGEKIAEVGQNPAGVSMLHFEIRLDGKSVDPGELLPGRR